MKIQVEFDSIEELVHFAQLIKTAPTGSETTPAVTTPVPTKEPVKEPVEQEPTKEPVEQEPTKEPEKKRVRRTKAEIEAARAAADQKIKETRQAIAEEASESTDSDEASESTDSDEAPDEASLRSELQQLGAAMVRTARSKELLSILTSLGVTRLPEIPAEKLAETIKTIKSLEPKVEIES